MKPEALTLLKEILSFPTKTGYEHEFVTYLCNLIADMGYTAEKDDKGNIFVTKGIAKVYPLVLAHLDTVHSIKAVDIVEEYHPNAQGELKTALCAYESLTGEPAGLGADDKNGVFVCLQLLEQVQNIKVFFAVEEETGCHGSHYAVENNHSFFDDIAYGIMVDSPENDTMSYTLMGEHLFDIDGPFSAIVMPILTQYGIKKYQHHPYTDSMVIREKFGFANLNVAAGYYRYHSRSEYAVIDDVENAVHLVFSLIRELGEFRYQ